MPVYLSPAFWFPYVTFVLSITTTVVTMNDNIVIPLLYVHNMFTRNIAIEKHTIHSVNDSDPWMCFRHCAKDCNCVTFQVTEETCELLDTDQHGAVEDLVNRPGTLIFSMQQSVVKVGLRSCINVNPCLGRVKDVREGALRFDIPPMAVLRRGFRGIIPRKSFKNVILRNAATPFPLPQNFRGRTTPECFLIE